MWSRLGEKGGGGRADDARRSRPAQLAELGRGCSSASSGTTATPQDVEWCHDGASFWIVQSRPVTTGRAQSADETEWTRANLAEVLPDLTSPQALVGVRRPAEPRRARSISAG